MDKCYANSLGGCSGKISKEHYISEHLLRELGPIKAKGFHWLRGEEKIIGASALTASVVEVLT
jgi:hypothetical protein